MLDSYGRDINYLRISVTGMCNLRCNYCMPEEGIKKKAHKEILSLETIEQIAFSAVNLGFQKIRITGGEPLVRKGIIDVIEQIAQLKSRGLKDLGLTTNGTLLSGYADELKKIGLTRVNISLDSLDEEKYAQITRGGKLSAVLEGIEAAKEAKLWPLKINVVLIGGFNDDEIEEFVNLTREDDVEIRFIELMPIGEASCWDQEHFLSGTEILKRVPQLLPLAVKGQGAVARLYKLPNSKGRVGIISPLNNHFCNSCNRIRITPDGKLKPCLHSDLELDIRNYGENYEGFLLDGVFAKPNRHSMQNENYEPILRNMNEIGG
ncbi:GTP 3',8-cyclase MoaA [Desulfitobacterium chlororespirans]|uniref:GTP 3',8-cyclase n=1 Tax=Desulfitobacterium chlororespirans DSM 11544 TaxID=1121395 RepID=A0A1M7SHF2_9FIRM|nr:GTP 3',8-cyclase MoaA [Desulfitobacterium chlororespirans]SHN57895.1 cyclic pyranopterin monophosphate synthase subunit MoaA [Desulfitobacterium chlororespirans DSM 11544]